MNEEAGRAERIETQLDRVNYSPFNNLASGEVDFKQEQRLVILVIVRVRNQQEAINGVVEPSERHEPGRVYLSGQEQIKSFGRQV